MGRGRPRMLARPLRKRKFTPGDFYFDKVLGQGEFSNVWLAREKNTNVKVAIKVINAKDRKIYDIDRFLWHETIIQKKLKHPNVIRRLTSFHHQGNAYFVLEYAAKQSLFDKLKEKGNQRGLPECVASRMLFHTAVSLKACHELGYLHGDIKPENILLDHQDNVKLSDFGYAWPSSGCERGNQGTTEYMAPELVAGLEYDKSIDLWALGVLCYELLCGKSPFRCRRTKDTKIKIKQCKYKFPAVIGEDARDLISKLLMLEPKERLSLENIISHPWIQKNCLVPIPTQQE